MKGKKQRLFCAHLPPHPGQGGQRVTLFNNLSQKYVKKHIKII